MSTTLPVAAKTVVVADATAFVRDRFKTAIEGAGHTAVTVVSTQELMLRVRADWQRLDLLVLDLRLPGTNGVEVVRAIRRVDGGRLPILVFSGTIASAAEVRALATLGIAGYVNEYVAAQHIIRALAPHLSPLSAARRAGPRVVLGVPVAYRFGNTIAAALTLNLGAGGMGIRTTSPLDKETHVKVRFRLPGAPRDTEVEARVAWSDRRHGMGLQFEGVSSSTAETITAFVDGHFFTNRKA